MLNADGYLDAGLHDMTAEEIKDVFVTPFPFSSTRQHIMAGYLSHAAALSSLVAEFEQFLNGSFTSNKNDPGDIDLVVFAPQAVVDALSPEDQLKLSKLVAGSATKAAYQCDAYFCVTLPDGHPHAGQARASRKYWMGEFGFDRKDVPKGIVRVTHNAAAGGVAP